MDGWVSYLSLRATSSLSNIFSSLSYFFSEQPLFLSGLLCSELPFSYSSASEFFSSRSCYNGFCNLQLQSRLPGKERRRITHALLRVAVPNPFCHSRLQTRMPGTSRQIDQHSRRVNSAFSTTQIRGCSKTDLYVKSSSRCCEFCRSHLSKALRRLQFFLTFWSPRPASSVFLHVSNRALATVLCTFCRRLSQLGREPRKHRPYFCVSRSHFTGKKAEFRARVCVHRNCYMSRHADVAVRMVDMLTMTIAGSSQVSN